MSSKKGGLLAFVGVVAGLASAAVAGVKYLNRKTMEKMEENDGQFNTMHSVFFNNLNVEIEDNIENAYLNCILGNLEVKTAVPVYENLHIEIFNLFGNFTLYVPEGVNVLFDAQEIKANVFSDLEECDDDAPSILISGKCIFGNVVIHRETEASEPDDAEGFDIDIEDGADEGEEA